MPKSELVINGEVVSSTNPLPTTASSEPGSEFDISDRADRDLGKVGIQVEDADVTGENPVPVTLATSLDASLDSIAVPEMPKGSVTTVHDAITSTATSAEVDCRGHNRAVLHLEGSLESSQTWTVEILGCAVTGGAFGKGYYQSFEQKITITYADLATDGVVNFACGDINNYIKIRATLSGGTAVLTVKVTPMNL